MKATIIRPGVAFLAIGAFLSLSSLHYTWAELRDLKPRYTRLSIEHEQLVKSVLNCVNHDLGFTLYIGDEFQISCYKKQAWVDGKFIEFKKPIVGTPSAKSSRRSTDYPSSHAFRPVNPGFRKSY